MTGPTLSALDQQAAAMLLAIEPDDVGRWLMDELRRRSEAGAQGPIGEWMKLIGRVEWMSDKAGRA